MLKYEIKQGGTGRAIIVLADDLQRWALHDSDDIPLEWEPLGKRKALAISTTPVKVYRKPHGLAYHREYMLHNARELRIGARFGTIQQFDTLLRNMYEYIQSI